MRVCLLEFQKDATRAKDLKWLIQDFLLNINDPKHGF